METLLAKTCALFIDKGTKDKKRRKKKKTLTAPLKILARSYLQTAVKKAALEDNVFGARLELNSGVVHSTEEFKIIKHLLDHSFRTWQDTIFSLFALCCLFLFIFFFLVTFRFKTTWKSSLFLYT